ncbi:uncharacterized protein EI90DRAFT_3115622 [Cantharellus anzutake]|uniref:uncharacterized protein n=1 Tax=Cantharellus anzutake TaxID=1750568 RepID=UPI001906EFA7|nr:uncharacterized protein EI90DRAFT_3115622 [Cantharellus anzutake]KAF8343136.1 hypothetical protein EI90DRAFT_3115622 [Cantharellus anzutake]
MPIEKPASTDFKTARYSPSIGGWITLGELAELEDGFEMLQIVATVLCLNSPEGKAANHQARSLRESLGMIQKNKSAFEFIIRMFLPYRGGTVSTETDTERSVDAILMRFFDIDSKPSFFCHSVHPIVGFGSTTPWADLLTSVPWNQSMGAPVGIFIGEAKRPETKAPTHAVVQATPTSSNLSVPDKKSATQPNFAQALNQTFLASLPNVMFPSWSAHAAKAPNTSSSSIKVRRVVMDMVLKHNDELFEELSAASFHGIVGEAFRVWREDVNDEESWLKNLGLHPEYDEILKHKDIVEIREDYHARKAEKGKREERQG